MNYFAVESELTNFLYIKKYREIGGGGGALL